MFINEENISNVYRFSKIQWATKIITPSKEFLADESTLIQILRFENAAKIFFVDKIIMVEGETDAYFFEHYLQHLHWLEQRRNKIKNYEIININGKGEYKKRNTFLGKFWIQSYFIGDRDNIVNYDIAEQKDLNHYYKEAKTYYATAKKKKEKHDRHYTRLVNTIKDLHPETYKYIMEEIKRMYEKNIFILENGDIETYLWLYQKWLEETITFCHEKFNSRIKDTTFNGMRKELDEILLKIFT
jgi:predicted ATP-dependent endonuclease of OLD family